MKEPLQNQINGFAMAPLNHTLSIDWIILRLEPELCNFLAVAAHIVGCAILREELEIRYRIGIRVGDASGIVAFEKASDFFGHYGTIFSDDVGILDDIDGDVLVNQTKHVQVDFEDIGKLDDVLLSELSTFNIHQENHWIHNVFSEESVEDFDAVSSADVVDDDSVFNTFNF